MSGLACLARVVLFGCPVNSLVFPLECCALPLKLSPPHDPTHPHPSPSPPVPLALATHHKPTTADSSTAFDRKLLIGLVCRCTHTWYVTYVRTYLAIYKTGIRTYVTISLMLQNLTQLRTLLMPAHGLDVSLYVAFATSVNSGHIFWRQAHPAASGDIALAVWKNEIQHPQTFALFLHIAETLKLRKLFCFRCSLLPCLYCARHRRLYETAVLGYS